MSDLAGKKIRFGGCDQCKKYNTQVVQCWHPRYGVDPNGASDGYHALFLQQSSYTFPVNIAGITTLYGTETRKVSETEYQVRFYTFQTQTIIDPLTGESTTSTTNNITIPVDGNEWNTTYKTVYKTYDDGVNPPYQGLVKHGKWYNPTYYPSSIPSLASRIDRYTIDTYNPDNQYYGNEWQLRLNTTTWNMGVEVSRGYGYSEWYSQYYWDENTDTRMYGLLQEGLVGPWYDPERNLLASWDNPLYFSDTLDNSSVYITYYNKLTHRWEIQDMAYNKFLNKLTGIGSDVTMGGNRILKYHGELDDSVSPFDSLLVGYQMGNDGMQLKYGMAGVHYNYDGNSTLYQPLQYDGTNTYSFDTVNEWGIGQTYSSKICTLTIAKLKSSNAITIKLNEYIDDIITPRPVDDAVAGWTDTDLPDGEIEFPACGDDNILTITAPPLNESRQRWYHITV